MEAETARSELEETLDQLSQEERFDGVPLSQLGVRAVQDILSDLKHRERYLKAAADYAAAEAAFRAEGRAAREFQVNAQITASEWFESQPLPRALRRELRLRAGDGIGQPLYGERITSGWKPINDYERWVVRVFRDLKRQSALESFPVEGERPAEAAIEWASAELASGGRADLIGVSLRGGGELRQEICRIYADGSLADLRPARAQVIEAIRAVGRKRERGSRREVLEALSERDYPNHVIAAALRELEDRGELPASDESRFAAPDEEE